ncbi:hypothetical protein GCM10009554_36410 [Kribbella koreensis]|uniref:Bulb-type lectin domain-containing protein n=2 Tax=Kribbella TaxID=182639 RepID=A0ABP6XWL4_9ACTN
MISNLKAHARALAVLATGAAVAGTVLLVPTAAQAKTSATTQASSATTTAAVSDLLKPGQILKPGQYRRSKNGVYTFIMQADGNAVLYKNGKTPVWSTATNKKSSAIVMQKDGNLVVISGRTPVWASGTHGSTNAILAVQNDSNLVIYNSRGKAAWSRWMVMVTLGAGRVLPAGQMLYSHNRIFRLQMQSDGNAVIVKNGKTPIWSTRTISKGAFATMQTDGNFVVYTAKKKPLWSSRTTRKGSVLQMQDDGNLVVVYGRTPVWASGTGGR